MDLLQIQDIYNFRLFRAHASNRSANVQFESRAASEYVRVFTHFPNAIVMFYPRLFLAQEYGDDNPLIYSSLRLIVSLLSSLFLTVRQNLTSSRVVERSAMLSSYCIISRQLEERESAVEWERQPIWTIILLFTYSHYALSLGNQSHSL